MSIILKNNRLVVSGAGLDADTLLFITAAQIFTDSHINAVDYLVSNLKTNNLWTKMKAIYPFVGGTATNHKFNLKDPRDLDAAYRVLWTGGVTHDSNGVHFNGSTGLGDTYFDVWGNSMQNDICLSYYTRDLVLEANTSGRCTFGSLIGNTKTYAISINRTSFNLFSDMGADAEVTNYNYGVAVNGMITGSRVSNVSNKVYHNTTLRGTNTSANTGVTYTLSVKFGSPSVSVYTTVGSCFASIGNGLSDAEVTTLYNIVQAYQTLLGRQV